MMANVMMANVSADWIAVDWGTSSLRVWAMSGAQSLAARRSDEGMGTLPPGAKNSS